MRSEKLKIFPSQNVNGAQVEKILDMASITLNKNSVPGECILLCEILSCTVIVITWANRDIAGDKSAIVPGGIRIGTPAMTTRGFTENEFMLVADFIHEGVKITQEAKKLVSSPKLQDFLQFITSTDFPLKDQVLDLKSRVEGLATQFPLPGL